MIAFVRLHFCSNRKAFHTKIKVRTHNTFNPNPSRYVFIAIIAMVQSLFPFSQYLAFINRNKTNYKVQFKTEKKFVISI